MVTKEKGLLKIPVEPSYTGLFYQHMKVVKAQGGYVYIRPRFLHFAKQLMPELEFPSLSSKTLVYPPEYIDKVLILVHKNKLIIDVPYNPLLVERIRAHIQAFWNGTHEYWEIDLSNRDWALYYTVPWLRSLVADFFPGKELAMPLEQIIATIRSFPSYKNGPHIEPEIIQSLVNGELEDYQVEGVRQLVRNGSTLVADDMGIGKTMQAIAYGSWLLQQTPDTHIVVICQASALYNWQKEIAKWTDASVQVLSSKTPKNVSLTGDFIILNYSILKKWIKELSNLLIELLVIDESQKIKNITAQRTTLAMKLAKHSKHRILLSGTPIENRPDELYAQIKTLRPGMRINYGAFMVRYCGARRDSHSGAMIPGRPSNLRELHVLLDTVGFYRRTRETKLELPPLYRYIIPVELTEEERAEYETTLAKAVDYIMECQEKIIELRRARAGLDVAQYRRLYREAKLKLTQAVLGSYVKIRQVLGRAKLPHAKRIIKEFLTQNPDSKLIVFYHWHKIGDELEAMLGDTAVRVDGRVGTAGRRVKDAAGEYQDTISPRQERINKFTNDPNVRVFLGSITAASDSINLQAANAILVIDLDWKPSTHMQAEGRAYRKGQKNPVYVSYLLAQNTYDMYIFQRIIEKMAVADEVYQDENQGKVTEELQALFGQAALQAGIKSDIIKEASK